MDLIHFNNIQPAPLRGFFNGSEIWERSLKFQKGKVYQISAPSGKGKSTFLHILYGLRTDFDGDLILEDKSGASMNSADWSDVRQNEISIVFQDLRLFPELTVTKNINLKNNLTNHKTQDQINEMCEQLEISDLINSKVETLSYGQRQRVAIVRAMCQPFSFLLLDEPFSHLDKENMQKAIQLIKNEVAENEAAVIITDLNGSSLFNDGIRLQL